MIVSFSRVSTIAATRLLPRPPVATGLVGEKPAPEPRLLALLFTPPDFHHIFPVYWMCFRLRSKSPSSQRTNPVAPQGRYF